MHSRFTTFRGLITTFILLVLSACMAPPPAPVVERDQPPSTKINYHIVSTGDTLHTIAWRYELDHQKLASLNGLNPPYNLQRGQRLMLGESVPYVASSGGARAVPVTTHPISAEAITVEPISVEPMDVEPAPAQEQSTADQVAVITPAPTPGAADPVPPAPRAHSNLPWQWPVSGAVSREYDANKVFKGININSSKGAQVQAAAGGVVVYAGSGLRGYGQLIILKHDDIYLSAYAHNNRILVSENDNVSQGQAIGEVGGDPSDPGRLYFEIREHGKPVDPEKLLPRQ